MVVHPGNPEPPLQIATIQDGVCTLRTKWLGAPKGPDFVSAEATRV